LGPNTYWKVGDRWFCVDENGKVASRNGILYDQSAVEAVLMRRWGKTIADLESELIVKQQELKNKENIQIKLKEFKLKDKKNIAVEDLIDVVNSIILFLNI